MQSSVSILAEIPEDLYESLQVYLEQYPEWDRERVFSAAISLFLLQNGNCDRRASRAYLDAVFGPQSSETDWSSSRGGEAHSSSVTLLSHANSQS